MLDKCCLLDIQQFLFNQTEFFVAKTPPITVACGEKISTNNITASKPLRYLISVLNRTRDLYSRSDISRVTGWCTFAGRFLKCGSLHAFHANIARNPLCNNRRHSVLFVFKMQFYDSVVYANSGIISYFCTYSNVWIYFTCTV